jgi:opacity protein-like surface antigen
MGFRLSRRITLFGGYRYLRFDTVTGEGDARNGTDLHQEGVIVGAGFRL